MARHNNIKKALSIVLVIVSILSTFAITASAASKVNAFDVPTSSKYAKVYTISKSGTTIPYTSKYLSTRGTTNGASSSAYIDNSCDELYLIDAGITNGKEWAYVSYPVSSGRRYAYIYLSSISSAHYGTNHLYYASASGKFYCSPRKGGTTSSSYYVDKGDKVYAFAASSSSGTYCQIMYPVSGNKWRIAWCTYNDAKKYLDGVSHTHNYNGGRYYEKEHPHAISVRCTSYDSCGGWKWTGEYYKVKDCPQCYPSSRTYSAWVNTSSSPLVLRKSASTSAKSLTNMPKGSQLTVLDNKAKTNGFYHVKYNGTTGYASASYITFTKPVVPKATVKLNVPLYKQNDSRWKNVYIGNKTIGAVGCTTTCVAMVYSYNTGKTVYPNTVKNMLKYSNNDLYWSSISNVGLTSVLYNCGVTNSMLSTIYSKLKAGRPVIIGAVTSSGGSQHWVVITGYTGSSTSNFSTSDFTVNDPGNQGSTTLKAFLANGSNADRTRIVRIMY